MILRKHQRETAEVSDRIVAGSPIRDIVSDVVPGGGKSMQPVIVASKLIRAGLAAKVAWFCPRMSLQDQGERAFLDYRFRHLLGHNLTIRSSTNQANPSRGTSGFITTFQALAVDRDKTALRDFERYPYILVGDEFHHLGEEGEWTGPFRELYDRAAFRLMLTGTLSRGDKGRIAFVPYEERDENEWAPCFDESPETALITYSRKEALEERAIIPLEFSFYDGRAEWQKENGRIVRANLSTGRSDASQALFTALKTEYASELLAAGIDHWKGHARTVNPNGSLMVVSANIETAKEYTEQLRRMGCHAEIATSDDTPQAIHHIKALKAGKLKILVAVAMISEGLDVPSISHIIYLTNVRTAEWIEQTISRAVRIDPLAGPYETQKGYIFAPADRMFVELARKIEQDQCEVVAKQKNPGAGAPFEVERGEGTGNSRPGITPLSSKLIPGQGDLFGAPYGLFDGFSGNNGRNNGNISTVPLKTQREIETELREEIDGMVRGWSRVFGYLPAMLNGKVKREFGKKREDMTVKELERVKAWLGDKYPVPQVREPGVVLERVRA